MGELRELQTIPLFMQADGDLGQESNPKYKSSTQKSFPDPQRDLKTRSPMHIPIMTAI